MVPKDREAALEKIRTSNTIRVILISFKAGSTGTYLLIASFVTLTNLVT